MGQLRNVQEVRVLRARKRCMSCQHLTSHFTGPTCPACVSSARRAREAIAREYVADYFRDHPMRIPRAELIRMQG